MNFRGAFLARFAALAILAPLSVQASEVTKYVLEAPFAEVRQDLGDAVINRGYKIDYEAYVGDMLKRTASDVDGKVDIYRHAEFIQFCSAVLSREAMEADPENIASCPYVLFVYETNSDPGMVHVGFRRLDETGSDASKAAAAKVNAVLDTIAREAAGQ